ncbi:hypothetical protein SUGI_0558020 [Cryptomeria japonica]|uniref:putative serine/threonine-protein kinase n=1 Tax=Cryptomeria japonica TaxID=3369 RepID=UPI002408B29B|nr:putative serine/threonine-protein kinase [Cryptomeria japonica]GLJ28360.1 hypothetical protein SUGI_0558020 [Cryptomeria japonica]
MDHGPSGDHGLFSERGNVSAILLVAGIFTIIVTIIVLIILYTRCCEMAIFNSRVRAPLLPVINEPHLRMNRNELLAATANFNRNNLIGKGGFSTVYKGILPNGKVVAVKWMKIDEETLSQKNFFAELKILGKLRHRNLLKILGYFSDSQEMALILEFMPNGSLENLLHGEARCPLEWKQRLNIAIGVAQGLAYLHHESRTRVVHCDLKPSNVLLDENFEPHIADFGVAKAFNLSMTESSCGPSWTIGYTAPERAYRLRPSTKSDVYSFGVMLLELITRQRPACSNIESGLTLVEGVLKAEEDGCVLDVLDDYLKSSQEFEEEILSVIHLALHCAEHNPVRRPTMREVVGKLMKITVNDGQVGRFNRSIHSLLVQASSFARSYGTSSETSSSIGT